MYTLFFNLLRDIQHNTQVAWAHSQINSASFMGWQSHVPAVNVPQIAGC